MHLHLDPIGGVAGDMFAAALLDAWPEWGADLVRDLSAAGFTESADVALQRYSDQKLTGSRFNVRIHSRTRDCTHRSFREIRELLRRSPMAGEVTNRAVVIFLLLAEAEGRVHGVPAEEVSFHEVGAWDSIIDIVSAAWLIDRLDGSTWSCAPLPMGQSRVDSSHGPLPIPAPATALLLRCLSVYQDGIEGERVTPTGAAILRYLEPRSEYLRVPRLLHRTEIEFGTHKLPGISNILRVLVFDGEDSTDWKKSESLAVCQFEVDDQTAEDLAVALGRLRTAPGVLDVIQAAAVGKKGRLVTQVQVLVTPGQLDPLLDLCFTETNIIGVRWQLVQRAVLCHESVISELDGEDVRVKCVRRPRNG